MLCSDCGKEGERNGNDACGGVVSERERKRQSRQRDRLKRLGVCGKGNGEGRRKGGRANVFFSCVENVVWEG